MSNGKTFHSRSDQYQTVIEGYNNSLPLPLAPADVNIDDILIQDIDSNPTPLFGSLAHTTTSGENIPPDNKTTKEETEITQHDSSTEFRCVLAIS